ESGGVGEAFGNASFGGNEINLGVAIVLAGKGHVLAVGREVRKHLVAFVTGQSAGNAAGGVDQVEIAGVNKNQTIAMNGGEAKQTRFTPRPDFVRPENSRDETNQEKQEWNNSSHEL